MTKRVSIGKWVDGTYRLRVSAPGFDVDNQNLLPSQIVFDSNKTGYAPIYTYGSFVVSNAYTQYSNTLVASWPALSYVPIVRICMINRGWDGYYPPATFGYSVIRQVGSFYPQHAFRVRIQNNGIYLNGRLSSADYIPTPEAAPLYFTYYVIPRSI